MTESKVPHDRVDVVRAAYSLVVMTRETMRRAMLLLVAVGVLTLGAVITLIVCAIYIHKQTALVEEMLLEQQATRATAQSAEQAAATVKEELDALPTLEIVPVPASASALVVVRPRSVPTSAPRPAPATLSTGGSP